MADGCSDANADTGTWYRVGGDTNYDVSIDPARIGPAIVPAKNGRWMQAISVWYRTDHKAPRTHEGKPFNREVVRSLVQCDSLWFKVARVVMSMNGEDPVSVQEATEDELAEQPWRRIQPGSLDDAAARVACQLAYTQRRRR